MVPYYLTGIFSLACFFCSIHSSAYEGNAKPASRIVGGSATGDHEFPWLAYIYANPPFGRNVLLTGSLISSRCVLTINNGGLNALTTSYDVFLGYNNMTDMDDSLKYYFNKDFYNYTDEFENISPIIIKLPKDVPFSETLYPIRIPSKEDYLNNHVNDSVVLAGWGITSNDYNPLVLPTEAHKINTTVLPDDECAEFYFGELNRNIMCTSGQGGVGFCSDYGAPINYYDERVGQWAVIGLYGIQYYECDSGFPNFSYRLRDPDLLDWIEGLCGPTGLPIMTTTTKPGFTCPSSSGIFPDPENCTNFYQCSNGNPTNYQCYGNMVFNPILMTCDFPENYPECTD